MFSLTVIFVPKWRTLGYLKRNMWVARVLLFGWHPVSVRGASFERSVLVAQSFPDTSETFSELLRGESQNTAESDVYSFGITLYEVYARSEPYKGEDALTVLKEVADPEKQKRPPVPDACPTWVRSLFMDCLQEVPSQRPEFEEIDIRLKRANAKNVEPGVKDSLRMKKIISLHDIFPRHIADKLEKGSAIEPEHHESVTVFFSDIVGYTTISSTLPAAKVSNMLDRLYDQFDALASLFDVWKVCTVNFLRIHAN